MMKKYIAPSTKFVRIVPTTMMAVSGWTPTDDKNNNGFGVVEEDKNNSYKDEDFGSKRNDFNLWDLAVKLSPDSFKNVATSKHYF